MFKCHPKNKRGRGQATQLPFEALRTQPPLSCLGLGIRSGQSQHCGRNPHPSLGGAARSWPLARRVQRGHRPETKRQGEQWAPQRAGLGVLRGPARSCQELEETKAKVRNVPRAFGPAACAVPGEGCQGRGVGRRITAGRRESPSGRVAPLLPVPELWVESPDHAQWLDRIWHPGPRPGPADSSEGCEE